MALIGKREKIKDDSGIEKEVFTVTFTNGTVQQLGELRDFLIKEGLKVEGDLEGVVRVGIAWLEKVKKDKTGQDNKNTNEAEES